MPAMLDGQLHDVALHGGFLKSGNNNLAGILLIGSRAKKSTQKPLFLCFSVSLSLSLYLPVSLSSTVLLSLCLSNSEQQPKIFAKLAANLPKPQSCNQLQNATVKALTSAR